MRKRTGDWRDLLSAYSLALDAKKMCMGLLAIVYTIAVVGLTMVLYSVLGATGVIAELGEVSGENSMFLRLMDGEGAQVFAELSSIFNPFSGGLLHFVLSALMYTALFYVWTGPAGIVSRLAALEYARDDLPTLAEARQMVRSKRKAYFLAPMMPFLFVLFMCVLNLIGGFIASAPWGIGRILLIFPGFPLLLASTVVMVFLLVLGVLSFGMMMPAVSVGGKDGFESWSTAYSYVLWGLRRFVCYTLLAAVVGLIAGFLACRLTDLLIYLVIKTVNLGYVRSTAWIEYTLTSTGLQLAPAGDGFAGGTSNIYVTLLLIVRALPLAYIFSYFFTANTIIFLLMRKDQDNIEIDEIYEEVEEEEEIEPIEEAPTVEAPAPAETPATAEEPTEPATPQVAEPEEETAGEEEGEAAPPEPEAAEEEAEGGADEDETT